MKLLGNYSSNLNSFHYAALLALINQAISVGDYAGGKAFDTTAVQQLQQQGQDFESLPLPSAGQRVTDDSINNPLNLLAARYDALQSETSDFSTRVAVLISMLEKDTLLIDQIFAVAEVTDWASRLPQISNAAQFVWDFSAGHGAVSGDIPPVDPTTLATYPARPPQVCVFDCSNGEVHSGIAAPLNSRTFGVKELQWVFDSTGTTEDLYGNDWAELSLLEAGPKLVFSNQPTISPENLSSLIEVSGTVKGGSVPIYVNLQFLPRRRMQTVRLGLGESCKLTPYSVQPDESGIIANGQTYENTYDFTVTQDGTLTSVDLPVDTDLIVYFTEYFPAYQCSINQEDWSDPIMLDLGRPYPDDTTEYTPIALDAGRFPLTDELGTPTGLYMRLMGIPQTEQKFQVTTPAASSYGSKANLVIDLERPAYITGLTLSPFSSFPARLTGVTCEGSGLLPTVLFHGSVLFDRKMTVCFPRTVVRRLTLTFIQENYTFKEYTVDPPDKFRRDTLASLQAVLPFAVRRTAAGLPVSHRGALYEFGLEDIAGVDWNPQVPGILVTGPYRVAGIPDVLSLALSTRGSVDTWLYSMSYSSAGQKVDENLTGTQLVSGTSIPVPLSDTLDRSLISYTDFYLKFISRSSDAIVEKFFLQVSHV